MSEETVPGHHHNNGDLPTDDIDLAVSNLVSASAHLRERKEALRQELASVSDRLSRYDSAITALTRERKPAPPRAEGERTKVKQARGKRVAHNRNAADPEASAASGYPAVSVERQDKVLAVVKAIGHPAKLQEILNHPKYDLAQYTAGNALAHLRARGLIRYAGKTGNAALYAPFDTDTEGDE